MSTLETTLAAVRTQIDQARAEASDHTRAATIDTWQDGTTAPHDVLTAIRDRLSGRDTDIRVQARATALEQLAQRYGEAFAYLYASACAEATRKDPA